MPFGDGVKCSNEEFSSRFKFVSKENYGENMYPYPDNNTHCFP